MNARNNEPVLSVIIPTHNVHPWIRETLDTVLAQRVADMEVIVVDDHSTDDTIKLVEEIAKGDSRVRLLSAPSRGGGTARNFGVSLARGRYLIFCDGDDLVPEGAYRALVESLETSGSDIAFGDYLKFSPTESWRPTENWPAYAQPRSRSTAKDIPSILYGRACWNKAFRRTFWLENDTTFPDVPRSNDIVPMTSAYLRASSIDVIEDVVYLYRERQGTSSMSAKAASSKSFLSYLGQELECSRLVEEARSADLSTVFASLVFDRDGWVHLSKYLRSRSREGGDDPEVVSALIELVESTGRTIAGAKMSHKRLAFELVLDGHLEAASSLARVTSGPPLDPAEELDEWRRLIQAMRSLGRSVLVEEPWLVRLLAEALAATVALGSTTTDRQVLEIASIAMLQDPEVLDDTPMLFARDEIDRAGCEEAFAASRALGATIRNVESRRRLTIALELRDTDSHFELALFDPRSGVILHPDQSSEGGRICRFRSGSLPLERRLIAVVEDRETGLIRAAVLAADLPAYDRFGSIELLRRRSTLEVRRRRRWLPRAIRKAIRLGNAQLKQLLRLNRAGAGIPSI